MEASVQQVDYDIPLIFTKDQLLEMLANAHTCESHVQVVYASDDQGWHIVGNRPNDEEGDGVWMDTEGNEHDGPTG